MTVHIGLELPPEQYRALAQIATARHTQVHNLIEQLVDRALQPKSAPKPKAATVRIDRVECVAEIRRLHADGLNDGQISAQIGWSRSGVALHRNNMNLPSNSPRGRKKSTPNQIESTTA